MIKAFSVRVVGRVQGVYYRASAKEEADRLGVVGMVRNEPDGSVYIEAQGEEDVLEEFFHWCRRGPANAHVERCDIVEIESKDFSSFKIDRGAKQFF